MSSTENTPEEIDPPEADDTTKPTTPSSDKKPTWTEILKPRQWRTVVAILAIIGIVAAGFAVHNYFTRPETIASTSGNAVAGEKVGSHQKVEVIKDNDGNYRVRAHAEDPRTHAYAFLADCVALTTQVFDIGTGTDVTSAPLPKNVMPAGVSFDLQGTTQGDLYFSQDYLRKQGYPACDWPAGLEVKSAPSADGFTYNLHIIQNASGVFAIPTFLGNGQPKVSQPSVVGTSCSTMQPYKHQTPWGTPVKLSADMEVTGLALEGTNLVASISDTARQSSNLPNCAGDKIVAEQTLTYKDNVTYTVRVAQAKDGQYNLSVLRSAPSAMQLFAVITYCPETQGLQALTWGKSFELVPGQMQLDGVALFNVGSYSMSVDSSNTSMIKLPADFGAGAGLVCKK